jgi:hypothetical protein
MHPERDLVIAVATIRHDEGQVVEDPLAEALREGEPVRRRKVDPRLPLLGAALFKRFRRNPELHGLSSRCCLPLDGGLSDLMAAIVTQFSTTTAEIVAGLPSLFANGSFLLPLWEKVDR